ncbi:unnamed protein product [Ambrosiozyma monospora]|uniref:Unnamed protein product n=1 Tax=Ambrosiozyma monospora TaxID=43982 RepID=A0ACB5TRI8_AMBMO|nr:unnamed protein product [Ambrosiozyma monospora]
MPQNYISDSQSDSDSADELLDWNYIEKLQKVCQIKLFLSQNHENLNFTNTRNPISDIIGRTRKTNIEKTRRTSTTVETPEL